MYTRKYFIYLFSFRIWNVLHMNNKTSNGCLKEFYMNLMRQKTASKNLSERYFDQSFNGTEVFSVCNIKQMQKFFLKEFPFYKRIWHSKEKLILMLYLHQFHRTWQKEVVLEWTINVSAFFCIFSLVSCKQICTINIFA